MINYYFKYSSMNKETLLYNKKNKQGEYNSLKKQYDKLNENIHLIEGTLKRLDYNRSHFNGVKNAEEKTLNNKKLRWKGKLKKLFDSKYASELKNSNKNYLWYIDDVIKRSKDEMFRIIRESGKKKIKLDELKKEIKVIDEFIKTK